MTGYGRKEIQLPSGHVTVEIRSVNNRYLDIQIKAPRSFTSFEPAVKKIVQERCSRGRVDVFINRTEESQKPGRIVVDEPLTDQYIRVMRALRDRFGLSGDLDVATVASFPGLVTLDQDKEDPETVWPSLADGLETALRELDAMRTEEGESLAADIRNRLGAIEGLMQAVQTLSPANVEQARTRMSENLSKLLKEQPDPVRLAQEIAILAERTDVTEELTRLGSHLRQFRNLIAGSREPVGRKLDFLLQEMGREANTIASKAMNADIAHHVVDIKAELEKIREQVQNLE